MTDYRNERSTDRVDDGLGTEPAEALDADRPGGWAGVDDALGGTGNRPAGPDYAARDNADGDLDTDRPSGWAGVDDALGDTTNRPIGPDYGASDTTDRDTTGTRTGEGDS